MSESFFDKPAKLGSLLQSLVRRKGLAEQTSGQLLQQLWRDANEERVFSRSYVRRLKSGILEIAVTNDMILEELNGYLKHDLLTAMQQRHPDPEIRSLKFVRVRSR
ncbi:MAG: DUF721 domain-containing protein [Planctomycetaceae bacterium]